MTVNQMSQNYKIQITPHFNTKSQKYFLEFRES